MNKTKSKLDLQKLQSKFDELLENKKTTMNLREMYKNEKDGRYTIWSDEEGNTHATSDYVCWLEEKLVRSLNKPVVEQHERDLLITLIVTIDEFLPKDHFIRLSNSYKKLKDNL